MRISSYLLVTTSLLLALTACGNPSKSPKHISGHEDVLLKIAHADEASGDMPDAENLYLQAVASSPGSLPTRLELANFYTRQHADTKTIVALEGALKLDPNNKDIARLLANAYINLGEPGKALEIINQAIEKNSDEPLLYNTKGVALDMLGRYTDAQASYRKALALNPKDEMTFKANLSMSYIASHKYNDAVAVLLPLMNRPDVTPTIRQNLALAYGMKGENGKALTLGLEDLPPAEAKENVKFYHMVAKEPASKKTATPVLKAKPEPESEEEAASEEEEELTTPVPDITKNPKIEVVKLKPAIIQEPAAMPAPQKKPLIEDQPLPPKKPADQSQEPTPLNALPIPALKPDKVQ
jgi:Flp pilus assembly protein TadD